MRSYLKIAAITIACVMVAGVAWADWFEDSPHKMHYPQLPDLSDTGLDVDATLSVVADDFLCTQSGPITDVHVWGSFYLDEPPQGDPGLMTFKLSIHEDIPAGIDGYDYSRPMVDPLWEGFFLPGTYRVIPWADGLAEQYWSPLEPELPLTPDTQCWQYNFDIPADQAFVQEEGKIYWLDVLAIDEATPGQARWGWKTSLDNWQDDSVVWDPEAQSPDGTPGYWVELRYPDGHPFHPQSMDQAFVITPEPATFAFLGLAGLAILRRRRH